jgi:hypothetical protein
VLLLPLGRGWAPPRLEHRSGWFAYAAEEVRRELRERLGAEVTALRHLQDEPFDVCEVESHAPGWAMPAVARWVGPEELDRLELAEPRLRPLLARWLAERSRPPPPTRPPWERPGWFAEASAWLDAQLDRLGRTPTGPTEQVKAAWSWSCILRRPTEQGWVYLKASYPKPPGELTVVELLAERWAGNLPRLLAADRARGWMLMEAFAEPDPEERTERALVVAEWRAALRRFAEIQIASAPEVERWLAVGCADLRPERVVAHLERIIGGARPGPANDGQALTEADAAAARALLPALRRDWARLAELGVPPAIVQMDFREGNFVRDGGGFVYFDWADTVVAHPFLGPARCLDYVSTRPGAEGQAAAVRRAVRAGYLAPWRALLPSRRLAEAFDLVAALNPSFQAVRWELERRHVEPGTPWGLIVVRAVNDFLLRMLRDDRARSAERSQLPTGTPTTGAS